MSATTYDFGAGPVPAHQHPNGGGWVADTARVADTAYVGPYAKVAGGTIHGGTIEGGTIHGGTIWGGTIWGERDILVLGPVGSEDQLVTLVRDGAGHLLGVGCWHGHQVDELAAEVQSRCPDRADEYALVEALLRHRLAEWAATPQDGAA